MRATLTLPKLAETTDVMVIDEWLVAPGDVVREGQALANVETDKAIVELPSPRAGTIVELLVPAGEELSTGNDLCVIDDAPV
jgi:pyruvate/2-oxoglutarate dehydrogenase complex dihydrolipoamide acyltransferase (E2) component